jgi:quercetin dioxygenase-like cupin family protein
VRAIRRFVTGLDEQGRSRVDPALSTAELTRTGDGVTEIWGSPSVPTDNDSQVDHAHGPYIHDPLPGGVKFRFVEFAPGGDELPLVDSETMDFVIVVDGEIVLRLDAEEVTLRQGDCAILRGHAHRWANRTDTPVLLAGGLVDARKQS